MANRWGNSGNSLRLFFFFFFAPKSLQIVTSAMKLEDSGESLGLQGDPTSPSSRKSVLNIHWKDWCWSWNSNTLAITHWKRPWWWERLRAGEGDDRGWDGWMASPTQWTCVWVNSGSWWWIGRPGVLQFMGSQRVRHNWATELNWTEYKGWVLWLHCNYNDLIHTMLISSCFP